MIYEKKGQSICIDDKTYSVSSMVWTGGKKNGANFATVLQIFTEQHAITEPTALCEFGDGHTEMLLLKMLEPVANFQPHEIRKCYALHYFCDGADGQQSKVIGISADKSLLLRMMVDNVKDDAPAELSGSYKDEKQDVCRFIYENDDPEDTLYIEYEIAPVPVVGAADGGTSV